VPKEKARLAKGLIEQALLGGFFLGIIVENWEGKH